jgi:hypothetical protein
MKPLMLTALLIMASTASTAKSPIQFNQQGQLIPPDEVHLARGLEHEQDGFPKSAIDSFTQASAFGNVHARFFIGLIHLQQGNPVEALAWLYLTDAQKINREEKILRLKAAIMADLSDEQLHEAEALLLELEAKHNNTQARINRERWRDGLQFTGTNLRGRVTPGVKVYANARLELRPNGTLDRMTATPITSFELRQDLEAFVVNYHYDLPEGTVEMRDIETEE